MLANNNLRKLSARKSIFSDFKCFFGSARWFFREATTIGQNNVYSMSLVDAQHKHTKAKRSHLLDYYDRLVRFGAGRLSCYIFY